jgi:hypothetical protein
MDYEDVLRERAREDPEESEDEDPWLDAEECEARELEYRAALIRLKKAVPQLDISVRAHMSGLRASNVLTWPCRCGNGRMPSFPWVLYRKGLGFCENEQCDWDHLDWRSDVVYAGDAWYTKPAPVVRLKQKPGGNVVVTSADDLVTDDSYRVLHYAAIEREAEERGYRPARPPPTDWHQPRWFA